MNWRDLARKPFQLLGIDAPRDTARLLQHRLLGKPYHWTDFPKVVQIEISNYCGPKYCGILCSYCAPQRMILQGRDYYEELSIEKIKWLLEQINENREQVSYYTFFLDGEILADLRAPEILRLGKKIVPNIKNQTFTSGVLNEKAWVLCDPHLDLVCLTLSAHNRELYKQVHGGDKFNNVMETMRYVTEHRHGQQLEVHCVLTKDNIAYLADWVKFVKTEFPEWKPTISPLVDTEFIALVKGTNLSMETQQEAIRKAEATPFWDPSDIPMRQPCALFHNASIDCHGRLKQCCRWGDTAVWNYGNIVDYMQVGLGLRDYWLMKMANKLRNPFCDGCNLKAPDWKTRLDKIEVKVKLKP